ncbi:MAG TPA: sugar transferase [Actinomycetes bacterium]|jgi:exopolysaccharide biosynthesis polyprenyl glycosylphosphotransferase|nr:sugar transferase [Actinomycetes bacterium]
MTDADTSLGREQVTLGAQRTSVGSAVKRRYRNIGLALMASDAACAAAALLLAYGVRFGLTPMPPGQQLQIALASLLWVGVFHGFSLYAPQRLAAAEEFRRIIGATSVGVVLLMLVSYWSDGASSRVWVGLSWLVALFLELVTRRLWRWWQHRLRLAGRLAFRTLIIGTNQEAVRLAATLGEPGSGFTPVGHVRSPGQPGTAGPLPVLGDFQHVRGLIRDHGAECLFVACTCVSVEDISQVAQVARQEGTEVRLSANLAHTLTSRLAVQQIGPVIALSLRPVRLTGTQVALKRAFDLVVASIILILSLPLWLVAAAAIRLTSSGPVFFHQQRVTKGGRRFTMHKFRTMRVGDDSCVPFDLTRPFFKLGNDPRVTRVGSQLRRLSIDELPQLWNIVKGEMSLVGPRPLPAEQVAASSDLLAPRHEVPAGMTGWWQIRGRSQVTAEEALALDQFYVENWSLTLDLYILLKTFGVVLQREGAY